VSHSRIVTEAQLDEWVRGNPEKAKERLSNSFTDSLRSHPPIQRSYVFRSVTASHNLAQTVS